MAHSQHNASMKKASTNNKLFILFLFTLGALFTNSIYAQTSAVPKLADTHPLIHYETAQQGCEDALLLATAMYQADSPYLYAPLVFPPNMQSTYVLGANDIDISGGQALEINTSVFQTIPQDGQSGIIFWQKNALGHNRIVVEQTPFNWQGDRYTLYLISQDISPNTFLAALPNNQETYQWQKFVFNASWRPPLIFQRHFDSELWIIDTEASQFSSISFTSEWQVYTPKDDTLVQICRITFPQLTAGNTEALRSLTRLTSLLIQTHSDGRNEGTLRPTQNLQTNAKLYVFNALLRPWTLHEPYNTRTEVDQGLQIWARQGPIARELYQQIQQQYPKALNALTQFYQQQYYLSAQQAESFANYALDIIYRAHFTFHSENQGIATGWKTHALNPWPLTRANVMQNVP